MAQVKGGASGVEWRIDVGDGLSKSLVPETGLGRRAWLGLKGFLIEKLVLKVWRFLEKAWDLGADDPRKVIHCLKVGMALTVVSLFYYLRPLYEGVGGNAMWAIMTVVVVFENTVGATICKSLNRVAGTSLAGFLAFGVHWVASQSGDQFEPIIVGASVFLLATAATFTRFIPSFKARFDYGAMIFILTFSLVTVSGYRVDKLFNMAQNRIYTIIIGTSLCILVTILICPIWAGQELNSLIGRNMDKLANSLEGCVAMYFDQNGELTGDEKQAGKKLLGYKCVLSSKAAEESMANFARWEPAHGRFSFKHPWKQYIKIGASMRSCACCIEALYSCINSDNQAPEFIKKQLSNICLRVSSNSSIVIKQLAKTIKTMKKSPSSVFLVQDMNSAVQGLQNDLSSLSNLFKSSPELAQPDIKNTTEESSDIPKLDTIPDVLEVISVATLASLLIEIAGRIQTIVDEVEQLAKLADFDFEVSGSKQDNDMDGKIVPTQLKDEEKTMKALQRV